MTIRQQARPKVVCWPDGTAQGRVDLSPIVAAFSTSKSIAAPAGQWSVTLLPSLARGGMRLGIPGDLERMLARPNAIISIGWDAPGGIMVGLVDSVRRQRTWGGERVADAITLSGSDFGKALVNDHIVRAALTVPDQPSFLAAVEAVAPGNTLTNQLPGTWGPEREDGSTNFAQATIREVADWVIRHVPALRMPVLAGAGGSGRLGDYITVLVPDSWNDGRIQNENLWTYQGSIWEFLNTIIDRDFYEVFVDSYVAPKVKRSTGTAFFADPDVPLEEAVPLYGSSVKTFVDVVGTAKGADPALPPVVLVIRPKPFDESGMEFLPTSQGPALTWHSLTTHNREQHHIVTADALISEQMGISDADVFSYYLVTSQYDLMGNAQAQAEGLFFPAVDLYALARHGVRAYESRITLLGSNIADKEIGAPEYTQRVGQEVFDFRNRLFNWMRLNEFMESGSITVAGRDNYRVGEPVFLPWKRGIRGSTHESVRDSGMRYYCVATQHQWSFGDTYTTTLNLTRGHNQAVIQQARRDIDAAAETYKQPGMKVAVGAG